MLGCCALERRATHRIFTSKTREYVLHQGAQDEMRASRASKRQIRKQRLVYAGAMVHKNKRRLPSRMMLAQVAGGKKPGPGGPPNNWLRTLRDDLAVFRSAKDSTKDSPRQRGVNRTVDPCSTEGGQVVPTVRPFKQPNGSWPGGT